MGLGNIVHKRVIKGLFSLKMQKYRVNGTGGAVPHGGRAPLLCAADVDSAR